MNEKITFNAPTVANLDVLVCGGGPAGIAAAIAASRQGASTMLVESEGNLGGMATSGLIGLWMGSWSRDGRYPVISGIFDDIIAALTEKKAALQACEDEPLATRYAGYAPWHGRTVPFEFEPAKRVFDSMILEAGVKLRFFTRAIAPKVFQDRIQGVFIHSKNGIEYLGAQTIIDATGDADIAARAGCPMLLGLEEEGHHGWMPPASLAYILEDVDWHAFEEYCRAGDYRFRSLITQLREQDEWPFGNIFIGFEMLTPSRFFIKVEPNQDGFNGLDADELSMGMIKGRAMVEEQVAILKKHFPGFIKARLSQTAPVMGVRTTRRIVGQYKVKVADVRQGVSFPDRIALSGYHWDMATPNDDEQRMLNKVSHGKPYAELPYRSLVPKNISNLIVAGRSISVEWDVMGIFRIMPACFAMGQAAGIAAAMAADSQTAFDSLNVRLLQEELVRQGAILDPDD